MPTAIAYPSSTLEGSHTKTRPTAVGEPTFHEAIEDRVDTATRHLALRNPVETFGNLFEIIEFDIYSPLPIGAEIDSVQLSIGWSRNSHSSIYPGLVGIDEDGLGFKLATEEDALWDAWNQDNSRTCPVRATLADGTKWEEYRRIGMKLELSGNSSGTNPYARVLWAEANVAYTVITPTFTMTGPSGGTLFGPYSQVGRFDFTWSHSRGRPLEAVIFRFFDLAVNPDPVFADTDYFSTVYLEDPADLESYEPPEFLGPGEWRAVAHPLWKHAGGPGLAVAAPQTADFTVQAAGVVESMPALASADVVADPDSGLPVVDARGPGWNSSLDPAYAVLQGRDGAGWFDAADYDRGCIPDRMSEPAPEDRWVAMPGGTDYMNLYEHDQFLIQDGTLIEFEFEVNDISADNGTRILWRFGEASNNRIYAVTDEVSGDNRFYLIITDAAGNNLFPGSPVVTPELNAIQPGDHLIMRLEVTATDHVFTILAADGETVLAQDIESHATQTLPITVPADIFTTGVFSRLGNNGGITSDTFRVKRFTVDDLDYFNADRHLLASMEDVDTNVIGVNQFHRTASSDLNGRRWRLLNGCRVDGTEPTHAVTPGCTFFPWDGEHYLAYSGQLINYPTIVRDIPANTKMELRWDFGPKGLNHVGRNENDEVWMCPGGWRTSSSTDSGGMIYIHADVGVVRGFGGDGTTAFDTNSSAMDVRALNPRYLRMVMESGTPVTIDYSHDGETWTNAVTDQVNLGDMAALAGVNFRCGAIPYGPTFGWKGEIYSMRAFIDDVEVERISPAEDIAPSVADPSNGQEGWFTAYQGEVTIDRDVTISEPHPLMVVTRPMLYTGDDAYNGIWLPKHTHLDSVGHAVGEFSNSLALVLNDDTTASTVVWTTSETFRGFGVYAAGGASFTMTCRSTDGQQANRGFYNLGSQEGAGLPAFDEFLAIGITMKDGLMQGHAPDGSESAQVLNVPNNMTSDPERAGWYTIGNRGDSNGRQLTFLSMLTCREALTEAQMETLAAVRYLPLFSVPGGSVEIERRLDNFPEYNELAPFHAFTIVSSEFPFPKFAASVYDTDVDRLRYVQYRARYIHPDRPAGPWVYSGIERFAVASWLMFDPADPTDFMVPEIDQDSYRIGEEVQSYEVAQAGRASVTSSSLGDSISLRIRTRSKAEREQLEGFLKSGKPFGLVDIYGTQRLVARTGNGAQPLATSPRAGEETLLGDFRIHDVTLRQVGSTI